MLQLAEKLSNLFQSAIGKNKGTLHRELENLENDIRFDYRLIRGLETLLMRRCVFEAISPVDPRTARRLVFSLAAQVGFPTTTEQRRVIIDRIAKQFGVTSGELERSLWSDFDENLNLKHFDRIDDDALIRYYNLGLTQTLLFKAVNLEFTVRRGDYKNIFRSIKRLGLMYFAETAGEDNYKINVEGPMALMKMTEKYGTSMAKLIPIIFQSEYWRISADILRRREGFPRVFAFELESGEVKGRISPSKQYSDESTPIFDSRIEEKFWKDFKALRTGWVIRREPEPLVTISGTVMIPDFSLEKEGARVYLEIVGFWTEQYIQRKLEKIRRLAASNLIIAVDKKLGRSKKFSDLPADVIFYEKSVPLKPILERLKKIESENLSKQLSKVSLTQLKLKGDVIDLKDLSLQSDIPVEVLMKLIEEKPQSGYAKVGDQLVSHQLLKKIDADLESSDRVKITMFSEASKLIEGFGITSPEILLDLLGYEVKWHGIDPNKAEISRETESPTGSE
jgi:hypothetical protein